MTLLNEGINRIRDMIYDDINKGQLGTSTAEPVATNTALSSPDASTLLVLDSKTKADKTIKFDYTLTSTGGSTATYTEYELQRSTATSVNYDRIVFTGISFVSGGTEDLIISKKYFFKSV